MERLLAMMMVAMIASASAVFAGEEGEERFIQGIISSYGTSSLVLNERQTINIKAETRFFDSSGNDSSMYRLSEYKWLYVEGTPGEDGSIDAEKIYFLPKYISGKERYRYEYMQIP
ncbi:MAG: hypothetical protein HYV24_01975 [Deltaproteobacteria bacterium]|nr:hypothetical protein [Deltaproteobacteria bacterium]